MKPSKKSIPARLAAAAFWLALWQWAAMAVGQEVFLVSPLRALDTLVRLLPTADFWERVAFSSGRILGGFALGCGCSVALAAAARLSRTVELLLDPVLQLVQATPVASFVILALVWVRGRALSILISFLMALPVLYSAVRTGIAPPGCGPSGCRRSCPLSGRAAAPRLACAGKAGWPPK